MKNKELKTLWKVSKSFWISGTIFWIVETIIFLIIEGWHYKATSPEEIFCDKVVINLWTVALNLTLITCINFLINLNNKKTNHEKRNKI